MTTCKYIAGRMSIAIVSSTAIVAGITCLNLYRLAMDSNNNNNIIINNNITKPPHDRNFYRNSSTNTASNFHTFYSPSPPPSKKSFVEVKVNQNWTVQQLVEELRREEVLPYVLFYENDEIELWRHPSDGPLRSNTPPPSSTLFQAFQFLHSCWSITSPFGTQKKHIQLKCEHEDMRTVMIKLVL